MKNITDVLGRPLEVGQEVVYNQSGAIAVGRITRISYPVRIRYRRDAVVVIEKTLGGVEANHRTRNKTSTVCNLDGIMILPLP